MIPFRGDSSAPPGGVLEAAVCGASAKSPPSNGCLGRLGRATERPWEPLARGVTCESVPSFRGGRDVDGLFRT